jgi:hypothetical protein
MNEVNPKSRKYGYYYNRYYSKYSRYYQDGGKGRGKPHLGDQQVGGGSPKGGAAGKGAGGAALPHGTVPESTQHSAGMVNGGTTPPRPTGQRAGVEPNTYLPEVKIKNPWIEGKN